MRRFEVFALVCLSSVILRAQELREPMAAGGTYDPRVPSPASVLGFVPGDRPARYEEVIRYCTQLAHSSPRVKLVEMGETYEHRTQCYLVISSPEHLQRLEQIREDNARLADPRVTGLPAARDIAGSAPAIVWIGYGIHGDELSSVDASMHVAYQLAAGTDENTMKILNELVVCLDPMENPDGRERFLAQMEQWNGSIPNPDAQSLHHTGTWPYGRGNHYLFDLNRDWFALVHPETRSRARAVSGWHPQIFIDSHEMGAYDTYLFSPPRQPINPNIPENSKSWSKIFAADQAQAFDRQGWSYYTREWNDDWYPGYANSYAQYADAVGILYEQAGVEGSLVKRPDGTTLRYPETVHHHVVSSLANLSTAARHRKELLLQFYQAKTASMTPGEDGPRAFYLAAGDNPARTDHLVETLLLQNIEVKKAEREFTVPAAHTAFETKTSSRTLPAGTFIVSLEQPMGRLARAILEFDPRMVSTSLQEERKSLEKEKNSRLYDITAWSLPLAYAVDACWSAGRVQVPAVPVLSLMRPAGRVESVAVPYGYVITCDDRGVEALAMLLQQKCKVRVAKEQFTVETKPYPRGTLLLRVSENAPTLPQLLKSAADSTGIVVHAVGTGLSASGPDLGGNDFVLLQEPRILLVGGAGVNTTAFGALWHLFDSRLRIRTSMVPLEAVASTDLRVYNTMVIPSIGDPQSMLRVLGKNGAGRLREWIEAGGTLVATGNASGFLADTAAGLSAVRLRHQALKDLDPFARAALQEQKAELPSIDSLALWSGTARPADTASAGKPTVEEKELAVQDERARLFMPRGAILRTDLDEEHWLTFGAGKSVPALVFTSQALLSKDPVRTPVRFSSADRLRLAGLLWPEARDRWARTAYATRESRGRGQVILFAGEPVFRGFFYGTERLLINAVLFGPGFGTSQPVEW